MVNSIFPGRRQGRQGDNRIGSHRTTPSRPSLRRRLIAASSVDPLRAHRVVSVLHPRHRRPSQQPLPVAHPVPRSSSSASSATASLQSPTICSFTNARTRTRGLTRATFAERPSVDRIIFAITVTSTRRRSRLNVAIAAKAFASRERWPSTGFCIWKSRRTNAPSVRAASISDPISRLTSSRTPTSNLTSARRARRSSDATATYAATS